VIDQLPMLTPDAARAARVVAKCHRKMAPRPKRRISEPVILAGVCALYLASVVLTALEVFAA
jgi:hypothetical protein